MNQYTTIITKSCSGLYRLGIATLIGLCSALVSATEPWQEVKAGQLYLRGDAQQPWQQSIHLKSHADVSVNGMVVEVEYRQTFRNTSDEWREAIYLFPLPEQAAVHYLSMTIGEREIIGQIREKAEAQKTYQQAKKAGKTAALLDQQRPNLFTQRIANIAPGETIAITIRYGEAARFSGGQFAWRLPTTLTPRYMPGVKVAAAELPSEPQAGESPSANLNLNSYGWAVPTSQVLDADAISPLMRQAASDDGNQGISITVALAAGLPLADVSALYHDVTVTKRGDIHQVELRDGSALMDRDFVLQWRPTHSAVPRAALFKQHHEGDDYAMVMVLPPSQARPAVLARDVVFILDTSGSMGGQSIEQAKAALARAIGQLTAVDRFNVVEFNSDHRRLFSDLREADTQARDQAVAWVGGLDAGGGTEMLPALRTAFSALGGASPSLKQIVFITDGAVGNEAELFRVIQQQLADSRLFTVGIGSAPNSYFMRKAAQFGRGTFTYIGAAHEVAEGMDALFTKLSSAAASNIQLSWPVVSEQFPHKVPDVYRGEPLLVFAKASSFTDSLKLTGEVPMATNDVQPWQQVIDLTELDAAADSAGIARLWARQKIAALEDQRLAGRDPIEVREEVLQLGLEHQLLTPYTSFVAVEQEPRRPINAPLVGAPVRNLVPSGQVSPPGSGRSIAYPATATTLGMSLWLGLLGAVLLLALSLYSARSSRRLRHDLA